MRKAVWSAVATAAAVLMMSTPAFAQPATDSKSVTVSAQVDAKAKLDLNGATTAQFADADPETVTTLSATPISVTVKARTTSAGTVTLTVLAGDDLKSGTDAITIDQLTWTAGGALSAGTMSKATAQTLGSWTGPGTHNGTQTYKLVNSWSYVTGTYSATITYTLTAP